MIKSLAIRQRKPMIFNLLLQEIKSLPVMAIQEVLDYTLFIKTRHKSDLSDILYASETSLAKDWLRPEEDEAWANL